MERPALVAAVMNGTAGPSDDYELPPCIVDYIVELEAHQKLHMPDNGCLAMLPRKNGKAIIMAPKHVIAFIPETEDECMVFTDGHGADGPLKFRVALDHMALAGRLGFGESF